MIPRFVNVCAAPCMLFAQAATAQPDGGAVDARPGASVQSLLQTDGLAGNWWGLRDDLEERGLALNAEYVAEFTSVVDGGINQRGSFRNLLTVDAELDLGTAFDIDGGVLFFRYLSVNAEAGGSADAGDIQVYSNIESGRSLDVIYELWYEQSLFDDVLRIKVGKVDANSEFNYVDAAGDFSNSSAGFSPTIFALPTYPDPATSFNVFAGVVDRGGVVVAVGYGLYDGALAADGVATGRRGPSTFLSDDRSSDYFHIAQIEVTWQSARSSSGFWRDGRVTVGGWHHDGRFERFGGGVERGTSGFFATGEARVFDPRASVAEDGREGLAAGGPAGIYAFGQYGWADDAISEVAQHFAGGVVCRGLAASRPNDSFGLYTTLAVLSDRPSAGFSSNELAFDAYYRVQLAPAIFVQPEVQYIVNPSGDAALDDALVLGFRVGLVF